MPLNVDNLLAQFGVKPAGGPSSNDEEYDFNFNNNVILFPGADVERALMETTHAGGVDEMTRFQAAGKAIGHFIRMAREGRCTVEDAWAATVGWNQAELSPPWDEDRLRGDFSRLLDEDIRAKGPISPPAPHTAGVASDWQVTDWRSDRFKGEAPERRWVVEGLIPQATAGTFAAVGDAGKSMMALKLALFITTAPTPNPDQDNNPKFFGCSVVGRGAAVILTSEDDADEVHRRLNNLDPGYARDGRPLYVVPMLSAGGVKAIVSDGPNGPQPTPFWYTLRDQLAAIPDLKLVVLDPLSAFISADTNDNQAGAFVMFLLAELATQTGAAIMFVHHVTKSADPTDLRDARVAIKGAGAYVDNGRWALVLWEAEQDDAEAVLKALGDEKRSNQAGVVYFGGLAKGNAPGTKLVRTMVRGPSGALEDVTEAVRAGTPRAAEIDGVVHAVLLAEFKRSDGRFSFPYSKFGSYRYVIPLLVQAGTGIGPAEAWASAQRLHGRGLLVDGGKKGHVQPVEKAEGGD